MPDGTFQVYQYIARVFSAFFILLQLIILLDSVYKLNEYLLERDQCAFTLIALTVVMIAGTFVGMGFLYKVRRNFEPFSPKKSQHPSSSFSFF